MLFFFRYYQYGSIEGNNEFQLFAIADEHGESRIARSLGEEEFLAFFEHDTKLKVLSTYTTRRPLSFDNIIPDGVCLNPETGEPALALFYHGCFYHSCQCTVEELRQTEHSLNPFGVAHKEVRRRFECQKQTLEKNHGIPKHRIVVMRECQWKRLKTASLTEFETVEERTRAEKVRRFLKENFQRRPDRMQIRSALVGGKVDCYNLRYSREATPTRGCAYVDLNSLYPRCV